MALTQNEHEWFEERFENLRSEIVKAQIAIAELRIKSSVWGAIGGLIPVLITIAIYFICRE